jgi:hypothetical protein
MALANMESACTALPRFASKTKRVDLPRGVVLDEDCKNIRDALVNQMQID